MNDIFRSRYRRILAKLSDSLEDFSWTLFASGALKFYGLEREVRDVDVLIAREDIRKAYESISGKKFNGKISETSILKTKMNGIEVEASSALGFDKFNLTFEQISDRIEKFELRGEEIPVLSIEDNLLIKALLNRKKDWEDIRSLDGTFQLDYDYISEKVDRFGLDEKRIKKLRKIFGD